MGTKINFLEDKVNIFGKDINLHFISSGQFTIPLSDSYEGSASLDESRFIEVFLTIDNLHNKSQAEKVQIAIKLQKQFGHPKGSRLINLIKSAGISDVLLDAVICLNDNYSICIKYKNRKSRTVVGFSLAYDFNETVAIDLKQIRNTDILHLIDHAKRFSVGTIIHQKCKEVIIDKIFKHWIALFRTPNLFLYDNGGEFNNVFNEISEQVNINIKTTAAESPWSNGIVEKHNATSGNTMEKVLSYVKCSLDVALVWCLRAKYSLLNSYGYSPNQLVFGYNPNFP